MAVESCLDAARKYLARGWQPLPIPARSKAPVIAGWPQLRLSEQNLRQHFVDGQNVGILLGEPSGDLVDVDLDCVHGAALAPSLLPETSAIFGRDSAPRSHYLYIATPLPSTTRYCDINGESLVEARGTGAQTVFPPSLHPSGDRVSWSDVVFAPEPARVNGEHLLRAVRQLAGAALLLRHWPAEGSRHECALAVSGGLVRAGWTAEEISRYLGAVANVAGDSETRDRASAGEYTAKRIASGRPATGWVRLEKLIGRDVARRLRELLLLAEPDLSVVGASDDNSGPYEVRDGKIIFLKPTQNGIVPVRLSNFTASVKEEILLDDGRDTSRAFQIEGHLADGRILSRVRVPVESFSTMNWPVETWGVRAVVSAGLGAKDRLREAIQYLSGEVPTRRIFTHTGWTKLDGAWIFLTAGGAVGVEGVEVDLPAELRRYALPCQTENPREAMEISLRLLDVAPLAVTAPLWAGIFRAPLASAHPLDVSLFLHGPTGALKSTVAALFLAHFGDFSRTTLPGAWSSTANALEHRAFLLKDVVFIVDDFAPSPLDAREMESKAARLLRAQGNLAGRGRLRSDLREHISHPPRGLIVSTGEQFPQGQSILARSFLIPLEPGAVNLPALTEIQAVAHHLPHAMAGYIDWLARQMDLLPSLLTQIFQGARARANNAGTHLRVPEALAHLWIGVHAGLQFAEEIGALSLKTANELREKIWAAFVDLGEQQTFRIEGERPSRRFLEVLTTVLTQGRAYVLPKGDSPDEESHADFLGWYDGDSLYLLPDAAFQSVVRFCRQSEEPFSVRRERLFRDLRREGLSECESSRTTTKVRMGRETRRVLRLRRSAIEGMVGETVSVENADVPAVPGFYEREG